MSRRSIQEGASVIAAGGIIAFPTDTVYGIGCDPRNESAIQRIFEVKGRGAKPIPLLSQDLKHASKLVSLRGLSLALAKKYWPGALTIVAPQLAQFPSLLRQGKNTVGVRVPSHQACVDLIRACGGTIAATSANLSGRQACRNAVEIQEQLDDKLDLILDGGDTPGLESTVVRVVGNRIEVLRKGAVRVSEKDLRQPE
jgi:L-threonylcarbamoyladenylate synthase